MCCLVRLIAAARRLRSRERTVPSPSEPSEAEPCDDDSPVHHFNYHVKTVAGTHRDGTPKPNQDAFFFCQNLANVRGFHVAGVCDGHGEHGEEVAKFVCETIPAAFSVAVRSRRCHQRHLELLREDVSGKPYESMDVMRTSIIPLACETLQCALRAGACATDRFRMSGCTLTMAVMLGDFAFFANVGDSYALLLSESSRVEYVTPQGGFHSVMQAEELARLVTYGARVVTTSQGNVRCYDPSVPDCPGLSVSRAFGDFAFRNVGVTSVPVVHCRRIRNGDVIVLASDGVSDALERHEIVGAAMSQSDECEQCALLVQNAVKAWGEGKYRDDVTAMVIKFF